MPEDQKFIYYASGESNERIEKLPQTEMVADKGYEKCYTLPMKLTSFDQSTYEL